MIIISEVAQWFDTRRLSIGSNIGGCPMIIISRLSSGLILGGCPVVVISEVV